ncbi:MAG: aryl-sulfate sulfotransferase [Kordiimonas sp.]|nr:aryl-sulfate sulfotransferase [Kordiimonas sp.]
MLQKHSVVIAGHQTSITLENIFWWELKASAKSQKISISTLITDIDNKRRPETNLSSACRIYILRKLQNRCTTSA